MLVVNPCSSVQTILLSGSFHLNSRQTKLLEWCGNGENCNKFIEQRCHTRSAICIKKLRAQWDKRAFAPEQLSFLLRFPKNRRERRRRRRWPWSNRPWFIGWDKRRMWGLIALIKNNAWTVMRSTYVGGTPRRTTPGARIATANGKRLVVLTVWAALGVQNDIFF